MTGNPSAPATRRQRAPRIIQPSRPWCGSTRGEESERIVAYWLGLPFTTYRYQLGAAIKRVTDRLWRRKLDADIS
jgi:hypothetical protein